MSTDTLSTLAEGLELTPQEHHLATRNHSMPLEALVEPVTPQGLHYLVIHWDIPFLDPATWRLRVDGAVSAPVELSLADLRDRPVHEVAVTMECAGNGRSFLTPRPKSQPWRHGGIGTAVWGGVLLRDLLEEVGLRPDAVEVVFGGADRGVQSGVEDRYARSLPVDEARSGEVLLAHTMNGGPIPPQHGAPVRLVVPGWYGMASVKWLTDVEVVTAPFRGVQQAVAFRIQSGADDPGVPVRRMRPRALMVPPGTADFATRQRRAPAGPVALRGRAWSGGGPVTRVEVAVDGRWQDAVLDAPVGPYAWAAWSATVDLPPGTHELSCRATDASGDTQPDEPAWNLQGMANNAVQRLVLTVDG
jgi:sulfane dehydrogenase subunit SoxC